MSAQLMASAWNEVRAPLLDPEAEDRRTARYWAWLADAELEDTASVVREAVDGGHWVRLRTPTEADYEAKHMQHSIGHSFARYSEMGGLYSLRDEHNVPQATILVIDSRVVHAREHRNARLSVSNEGTLNSFAAEMGWLVVPDKLPIDIQQDDAASNTRLRYLHRGEDGHKVFGEVIFRGRFDDLQISEMIATMEDGRHFFPAMVLLSNLAGNANDPGVAHEVSSVGFTDLEPTTGLTAEDFRVVWSIAYVPGFATEEPPARLC